MCLDTALCQAQPQGGQGQHGEVPLENASVARDGAAQLCGGGGRCAKAWTAMWIIPQEATGGHTGPGAEQVERPGRSIPARRQGLQKAKRRGLSTRGVGRDTAKKYMWKL